MGKPDSKRRKRTKAVKQSNLVGLREYARMLGEVLDHWPNTEADDTNRGDAEFDMRARRVSPDTGTWGVMMDVQAQARFVARNAAPNQGQSTLFTTLMRELEWSEASVDAMFVASFAIARIHC